MRNELIIFIDGVYPTQGTKLAYGWMHTGEKAQTLEITRSRTPFKYHAFPEPKNIDNTVIREYDNINSLNIARFLSPFKKITR